MKKNTIIIFFIIAILIIIASKFQTAKKNLAQAFLKNDTYYFIQEGIYTSEKIMKENVKDINIKYVENKNDKYYVYLGITKSETNAIKIKEIYQEMGYKVYIEEVRLANAEFSSNIEQFDLLINSANTKSEILTITEVVLANYEEIIKKQ